MSIFSAFKNGGVLWDTRAFQNLQKVAKMLAPHADSKSTQKNKIFGPFKHFFTQRLVLSPSLKSSWIELKHYQGFSVVWHDLHIQLVQPNHVGVLHKITFHLSPYLSKLMSAKTTLKYSKVQRKKFLCSACFYCAFSWIVGKW